MCRMRQTLRTGYSWEETLADWVALRALAQQSSHAAASASGGSTSAQVALPVPDLEMWLLDLFALEDDQEAQLDYVAQFKPPSEPVNDWNRRVSKVRLLLGCSLDMLVGLRLPSCHHRLLRASNGIPVALQTAGLGSCGVPQDHHPQPHTTAHSSGCVPRAVSWIWSQGHG